MSQAMTRTPGARRAQCARWLGLDHNPMRRTSDRVEAGIRLAVLLLLLTAVPIAAIAAGRAVDHMALRQARAQQAADHLVSAVLTQAAPGNDATSPYPTIQTAWAPARWTAPDGSARSGMIPAPAGAPKGSRVPAWISASGAITGPPASHGDIIGDVIIGVEVTSLVLTFMLLGAQALARRALDRQRISAWDAEWRTIGPLWDSHRI
jgi:hypothetical protein